MNDRATNAPATSPPVDAVFFDGRSARRHMVSLSFRDACLQMSGETAQREAPLAELRISEPMGVAPRLITFADGAFCEVRDHAALELLLAASGHRDRAHVRWQFDWRMVAAACAAFVALALAGYFYALPIGARLAAPSVPERAVKLISEQTLEFIDAHLMKPSKLPPEEVEPLVRRFAAMRAPRGEAIAHRVLFRDGGEAVGANAFALPDGTLVVTDQLFKLAGSHDEVIAVLAHELGHTAERHGMRMVLQGSAVGMFLTFYIGDVSTLLAAAPAALLRARYSRDMEREADAYGAAMLRENGLSPVLLASMLERLEKVHIGNAGEVRDIAKAGEVAHSSKAGEVAHSGEGAEVAHSGNVGAMPEYLSSHPETDARIRALRSGAASR